METYQFSQVHKATAVAFSPGSTFIATAVQDQVIVRSSSSLQAVKTWVCSPPPEPVASTSRRAEAVATVDHLSWSSGGSRILAFSTKGSCAWVFDLSEADEVCRLTGDLVKVEWGGDDVLSWSDRGLAIHDLSTGSSRFIQSIQTGSSQAHTWSPDHRYLAVLERHYGKDYVGVYDRESLARNFPLPSGEPRGIAWSPCGKWLAVWDWHLSYAIHFYSPVGAHLSTFTSTTEYDHAPGIRTVAWAPNGRHVAVGSTEGSVTVIESESWKSIATLRMYGRDSPPTWHEPAPTGSRAVGITQFYSGQPASQHGPVTVLGFSPDGTLLFFGQENLLHIYEFLVDATSAHPDMAPAASISFNNQLKAVQCCPTTNRLAMVTRNRSLYLWDRLGVEGVDIPDSADFVAVDVQWSPDGHSAVVCDRQAFCIVYEDVPDGDNRWEEEGGL